MTRDLHTTSAVELADRIRREDVSPVDVVEACLARIEERNDDLTAFVTVIEDDALAAARDAERAVQRDDEVGRLHGVPVALKDMLGWKAGVRNTFGSRLFSDFVPDESAVFTERLEREGAIVLGKTNTPEFALGTSTDNLVVGRTGNPFDPNKNAGGSSGGAAAAVVSGMVPLAQGSDAGGSIRIPSALCGAYGIKPTFARIPMVRPLRPNTFLRQTPYFQFGPIARHVEDAALMLSVMAGGHPDDPFVSPDEGTDFVASTRRSIDDLRIAYAPDLDTYPIDSRVRAACDDAATVLDDLAGSVDRVRPDIGHSREAVMGVFYTWATVTWGAMIENMARTFDIDPEGADRDQLRPEFVETILEGEPVSAREFKRTEVLRTDVYAGIERLFRDYDLLVMPTLAVPTFDHDDPPTEIEGVEIEPLRGWVLTQPFNMTGHPAASISAGYTDDGLPVGLQIVGPRFADERVLAASAAFERVRPWIDRYPR